MTQSAAKITQLPTLTITPQGVAGDGPAVQRLAAVSSGDLQVLDRALANYKGSRNQLINASADLLAVCGTLARVEPSGDINPTRMELSRAIIDLKYKVAQLDYPPAVAENLCLLFAIALDEFILVSDWGEDSGWENRTLVADLFGFRDGGDRFYQIADRALMQPRALREFLEIVYIFLKLGYRGKYTRGSEHERDRLVARLETAMKLLPVDQDVKAMGRPIKQTRAPASQISLRHKLLAAGLSLVAITVVVWGLRWQQEAAFYSEFQRQRATAQNEAATDFVFSSATGDVAEIARE